MITIALPKGRISDDTLKKFEAIFNEEFKFENRKLVLEKGNFRFLSVRNQDVPVYVKYGAADLGIVGNDVLLEKNYDLVKVLDLEIGKCKIAVGVRKGEKIDWSKSQLKVATKHEMIARKYFEQKAVAVDIVKLYGSIELAPIVGLSDCIVDIVETGATMKENGLEVAEVIMESSVFLVANKNSYYKNKKEILELSKSLADTIK
jgi:ATP phosphoribosyltransferase